MGARIAILRRAVLPVIMGVLLLLSGWARAQSSVELPVWSEEDTKQFAEPGSVLLGGGLWPEEMIPEEGVEALRRGIEGLDGALGERPDPQARPRELDVPDLQLMSRDMERDTPRTREPVIPLPLRIEMVPEEFHAAYFTERPREFLIDPQHLLTEQKRNDVVRFLEYHQEESAFAIYVLVFGPNQEFPDNVSLRDLHGQWFGAEEAVLLAYFLGQPKRALLEFGGDVAATVDRRGLSAIIDSCIEEGTVAQNPFNQFERFSIELSIRLYWLEKEYLGQGEDSPAMAAASRGKKANAAVEQEAGESLAGRGRVIAILVVSGLALTGLLGAAWWKFYPTTLRVHVFPDYEIAPRLSAPHTGGGHAVMFFGKREAETLVYSGESGG